MIKALFRALATLLAASLVAPLPSAEAATRSQRTEYHITLSGLPVANAVFSTKIDNSRYTISGDISTSGLVDLVADIRAKTSVTGVLSGGRLAARNYDLVYSSGKKTRTYKVSFNSGRVTDSSIAPVPKRPKEWVPVSRRQLASVLDPISGLIFPEGYKVCPRSLPIFDGETRMDLVLTKKDVKPISIDGYSGDALVCSVRFVPKGGYKKGRKDIEYLRNSSQMEIWFAAAGDLKLIAPVYVRIPTQVGMLTIAARKVTN